MSVIIEEVRKGLEDKIQGIRDALKFVRDPKEINRLNNELKGALTALERLNKEDTRSPEELEKVSKIINDKVEVEAPSKSWKDLSSVEKFVYQIGVYSDKLSDAYEVAKIQFSDLKKVCEFFGNVDLVEHPYLEGIYKQFKKSLLELEYSVKFLEKQVNLKEEALSASERSFEDILKINKYLNNPMSLPNLVEEKEAELGVLKNEQDSI